MGFICLVGEKAGEVQEMKIRNPISTSIWGLDSSYIFSATKQRIEGEEMGFEVPIHENKWGLFCLVGEKAGEVQELKIRTPTRTSIWGSDSSCIFSATK